MAPPDRPRKYTDAEVEEILRRALARQQDDGTIEHADLLDAAREVGINPRDVEAAAQELALERTEPPDARALAVEREEREELAAMHARARQMFLRNAAVYLVVNAFLYVIDRLTPGGPWFYWVALGWGLALAMQAIRVALPHEPSPEERAKRRAKLAQKQARLERRRAKHELATARAQSRTALQRSAVAFERTVEEGAAALLDALAKHARRQVDRLAGDDEVPARRDEPPVPTGVRVGAEDPSDRPERARKRAATRDEDEDEAQAPTDDDPRARKRRR